MEKIAIIGTGIAGMGSAWFLQRAYDVTLFEKNTYVGGHTNTITVSERDKDVYIDTGFMVFNKVTYPNLVKLFNQLEVPVMSTDMSFSVQHVPSGLDYSGSGLNGLFSQRSNVFNPRFIRMLLQINRFNKECLEVLTDNTYDSYTLADYIRAKKYGDDFLYKYLIPMSSAVWSTPPDLMLKFPASTLIRFFYNHGFLGLNTQHQWYTVREGSQSYRKRIIKNFEHKIRIQDGITSVKRGTDKVFITTAKGDTLEFDKVIFATHADEARAMLADPTPLESELLAPFSYQYNKATLHTDDSVMPATKRAWSSWNYRIETVKGEIKTSTIYYMNKLQKVSDTTDYFVSINDPGTIRDEKIIKEIDYHHPLFDLPAIKAQDNLQSLNRQGNNTYFCGSYFKYGFHEDAFASSVALSKILLPGLEW